MALVDFCFVVVKSCWNLSNEMDIQLRVQKKLLEFSNKMEILWISAQITMYVSEKSAHGPDFFYRVITRYIGLLGFLEQHLCDNLKITRCKKPGSFPNGQPLMKRFA